MSRIQQYFNAVSDKIASESAIAGTTLHKSNIGTNRERIVEAFLSKHLPRRLRASIGGQVISHDGTESKQVDIIVSSDIGVRFDEHELTFVTGESVAAAFSVKSYLNKSALYDSLENLGSIPSPDPQLLTFKLLREGAFQDFSERHPSYYVFAYDGVEEETCRNHIRDYYTEHPEIPKARYPKAIIVNNKYIVRYLRVPTRTNTGVMIDAHSFFSSQLIEKFRGYPYVCMLNDISSYVDWLAHMDVAIDRYFNFGYGLSDWVPYEPKLEVG